MRRIDLALWCGALLAAPWQQAFSQIVVSPKLSPISGTATTLNTLSAPMAPPSNLSVTGTPASAALRWDPPNSTIAYATRTAATAAPGVTGYYVSRTDPNGATVRLNTTAISVTRFDDQSGGIRPGSTYTYHITAVYSNGGYGPADVAFTAPAAAVPTGLHLESRVSQTVLTWTAVAGAASYQIVESWTESVTTTTRGPDGRANTTVQTNTNSIVLTTVDAFVPISRGGTVSNTQTSSDQSVIVTRTLSPVRYEVGALYAPSSVAAPRSQWPSFVY